MKKMLINNNYTKLISATFITRFGDALEGIAFSWMVYIMTGSKVLMGTLFAISMIPNLITLPFAGVLADVYDKKKITVISDFARGITVCVLGLFYYFNILEVWHIFAFVILNSFFESFADPARGSMLPSIIKKEEYVKGTSYLNTSVRLGELIGVSIAGIIIATAGVWGAIFVDGITFFISAVVILAIKYKDNAKLANSIEEKSETNIKNEVAVEEKKVKNDIRQYFVMIKEGVKYVVNSKLLLSLVLLATFTNFSFVPFNVLRPVYVDEVLNMGAKGMSYLAMAMLIGMVVGGFIYGKFGNKLNPIKVYAIGLIIVSLNNGLMGAVQLFGLVDTNALIYTVCVSFLIGFFVSIVQSSVSALIMKLAKPEMIGRLSSILSLIALCAMPLGGALVGFIGDSISVTNLFILMGALGVIVAVIFGISNRNTKIEE